MTPTTEPIEATVKPLKPLQFNPTSIYNAPKLTGRTDYKAWLKSIEIIIDIAGGYDLLSTHDTEDKVPRALLEDWKAKQRQCLRIINATLGPSAERVLEQEKTVFDTLQRAKKEYLDEGLGALQVTQEEWNALPSTTFDDVRLLGQKIRELQEGFARIGAEHRLPESQLVLRLLDSLDERFDPWKSTFWSDTRKRFPTFDDTLQAAEAEDRRLQVRDRGSGNAGTALFAGRKRGPTNTPLADRVTIAVKQCTHCGKRWHIKEDCWELHPEARKPPRQRQRQTGPPPANASNNNNSAYLATQTQTTPSPDDGDLQLSRICQQVGTRGAGRPEPVVQVGPIGSTDGDQ